MSGELVSADEAWAMLDGITPGPWRYGPAREESIGPTYLVGSAREEQVAIIVDVGDPRDRHDARLIAAAPDLARTVIAHDEERARFYQANAEVARLNVEYLAELVTLREQLARRDEEYLELARRSDARGFELRAAQTEAHTARGDLNEMRRRVRVALSRLGVADCDDVCAALDEVVDEAEQRDREAVDEANALRVERDALRDIIEGRTTAPTRAEIEAHEAVDGCWRVAHRGPGMEVSLESLDAVGAQRSAELLHEYGLPCVWWALDSRRRPCAWPVVGGASR